MSAWIVQLDGGRREEQVTVTPAGPGLYQVEVGGETLRLDVFAPDPSTLGLLVDCRNVPVRLDPRRSELRVEVLGSVFPIAGIHERS